MAGRTAVRAGRRGLAGRLGLLRERNFAVFLAGFATSMIGAQMAGIALVFAVLGSGGSPTEVGLVLTARILPLVLFMLGGGVIGDRFSRRHVMIGADSARCLAQAALAGYFAAGVSQLGLLLALAALTGISEALFEPSLEGMVPALAPSGRLQDANALIGLARSIAAVAGPALAGVLVALSGPVTVLVVGAVGYGASVLALACLRFPRKELQPPTESLLGLLRSGWTTFRSRTWLWVITAQFAMFNLLVWAPFLVLGPAASLTGYGGASAWGTIMACYGAGSILAGLAILGRTPPRRPLVVTSIVTIGWVAPSAGLALHAPLIMVAAGAVVAGVASATFGALWSTAVQQRIPAESLSRVQSYVAFGAFALGPVGLAAAGPVAAATSIGTVLTIGVCWQLVVNPLLLLVPTIRQFRQLPVTGPAAEQPQQSPGVQPPPVEPPTSGPAPADR